MDLEEDSKEFIGKKGEPLLRSSAELQRRTQPAPRFLKSFPKVSDVDLGAPLGSQEAEDGGKERFSGRKVGLLQLCLPEKGGLGRIAVPRWGSIPDCLDGEHVSYPTAELGLWWYLALVGFIISELNVVMAASLLYTAFTA